MTTKYGLRALEYLAKQKDQSFIQVRDLSRTIEVPAAYLSKIVKILAQNNIVETRRGLTGGVRVPQPEKLSFYDICVALRDPIVEPTCILTREPCNARKYCLRHNSWRDAQTAVAKFLKTSRFADKG